MHDAEPDSDRCPRYSSGAGQDRCVAPPAPDRRLGPARRVPESALWIAGPDGRMAAGLRLGAGKGLEFKFNVAAEAAARAPDPRESRVSAAGPLACG